MVNPLAVVAGVQTVASIYSGIKGSQSIKKAGQAAYDAYMGNIDVVLGVGEANADAYLKAGAVNAGAILTIGEANAVAVERATARNILMYGLQATEDRRRFVLNQKLMAGGIRARVGASGVQTNTGTPLNYLHAQVRLSIQERRFGDLKTYWTLRNMAEEGADRAAVIRLTASENAKVVETNAEINAEMAIVNSEAQAEQLGNAAEAAKKGASIEASNAMWQGVAGAITPAMQFGYQMGWFTPQGTTTSYLGTGFQGTWSNQTPTSSPYIGSGFHAGVGGTGFRAPTNPLGSTEASMYQI